MPIPKPQERFDAEQPAQFKELPGTLGVFEIGDADGNVIRIGKADPRVTFRLRQAIAEQFRSPAPSAEIARNFRYEVTSNYHYSRWIDLLTRYHEDHDALPAGSVAEKDDLPHLGRFRWKLPAN